MKGQFEFTQDFLVGTDLIEMEVVKMMLDQQLRKAGASEYQRAYTGWYARKTDPHTGNRQYLWNTEIIRKLTDPKYEEYFKQLKIEGWEIPYNI